MRIHAITVWDALFLPPAGMTPSLTAIQQRFLASMRKKVKENLDPQHWFYPLVVRLLMAKWGIPNAPGDVQPLPDPHSREESDFYVFVYTLVKRNYLAIRRRSVTFADELLPEQVEYVEDPAGLRQTWFRGRTSLLALDAPPAI
jgi:hypothetical protein